MKNIFVLICTFSLISFFCFNKDLEASESKVKIMFMDTLYGACIGAVIGGAIILNDSDNAFKKLSLGITIGSVAGLTFGVIDSFGLISQNFGRGVPTKPLLAFNRLPSGKINKTYHLDIMSVYF